MGFEPTNELPRYTLSKRAPSTTRPILRDKFYADIRSVNSFLENIILEVNH